MKIQGRFKVIDKYYQKARH